MTDYEWPDPFDRALAEIVADAPLPRCVREGWSTRTWNEQRVPLRIELDDLPPAP